MFHLSEKKFPVCEVLGNRNRTLDGAPHEDATRCGIGYVPCVKHHDLCSPQKNCNINFQTKTHLALRATRRCNAPWHRTRRRSCVSRRRECPWGRKTPGRAGTRTPAAWRRRKGTLNGRHVMRWAGQIGREKNKPSDHAGQHKRRQLGTVGEGHCVICWHAVVNMDGSSEETSGRAGTRTPTAGRSQ